MENNSIPQQPYYPPSPNQSPNHWKTAMIVLLIVLIGGIAIWIFKSQMQSIQLQNVYQQKPAMKNTVLEPTTSTNQTIPPVAPPLISKSTPSILYQYDNYSSKIGQTYQSDLYGKSKQEVNIGFTIGGRFVSSRNKKYLARWSDGNLEVASAQNPSSFKQIIGTMTQNTRLGQVIFSSDGTKIAFFIIEDLEPDQTFGPTEKNLYIINVDGTNQKLIKRFREPESVVLEGINFSKNELYWFETGEGGFVSNFTIVNLVDGSIKEIKKELDPGLDFSFNFTADFSRAYYIKDDKTIIEYTLLNNNQRVLYEFDNAGKDQYGNKSMIDRLRLSPNDNLLVFSRFTEPDNKEIVFLITLPSGELDTFLNDPRYYNIGPYSWSPDGKYLWFETWCMGCGKESGYNNDGEYYIMNVETKTMNLFFRGTKGEYETTGRGVRINESISFITWLNTD